MNNCTKTARLAEVKRHDPLFLYRDAMCDVGSAAQSLAAMCRLARKSGEVYATIEKIANLACLPTRTVERHLVKLCDHKWLQYRGRQRRRRTPTYSVPECLRGPNNNLKFAMLPRWAAELMRNQPWSHRAIFACVVSHDSLIDARELDDHGRDAYTVRELCKHTGLYPQAVVGGKDWLSAERLVTIDRATTWRDRRGRCRTIGDALRLNPDFPVSRKLIDRVMKVADFRRENGLTKGDRTKIGMPSHRIGMPSHRMMKVARPCYESGGCPTMKVAVALNGTMKGIKNGTAELADDRDSSACARVLFSNSKQGSHAQAPTDYDTIDFEERRRLYHRAAQGGSGKGSQSQSVSLIQTVQQQPAHTVEDNEASLAARSPSTP